MKQNIRKSDLMTKKDWIQYGTAIAMIVSGIVLAFLSFFKNEGDISEGVLWYVAQALTYAGGIFGVSIYFKTKLGDFESRTKQELVEAIEQAGNSPTKERGVRQEPHQNNDTGAEEEMQYEDRQ